MPELGEIEEREEKQTIPFGQPFERTHLASFLFTYSSETTKIRCRNSVSRRTTLPPLRAVRTPCISLSLLLFVSGSNSEAQAFLQRDGQVIIRMRGLPFDATAKDVVSAHAAVRRPCVRWVQDSKNVCVKDPTNFSRLDFLTTRRLFYR